MRNYISIFINFIFNVIKSDDFKEHDVVVLIKDLNGITKGTRGTIVFDYESSGMYEVEFFDEKQNTIGVIRVLQGDLKKWVN